MVSTSLVAAVALALVHLAAGKLRFLEGTPRSVWLSIAGGVSVAYVFVHLLPDLNEGQEAITGGLGGGLALLEHHVYVLALLGLAVFSGLERAAITSSGKGKRRGAPRPSPSSPSRWGSTLRSPTSACASTTRTPTVGLAGG